MVGGVEGGLSKPPGNFLARKKFWRKMNPGTTFIEI